MSSMMSYPCCSTGHALCTQLVFHGTTSHKHKLRLSLTLFHQKFGSSRRHAVFAIAPGLQSSSTTLHTVKQQQQSYCWLIASIHNTFLMYSCGSSLQSSSSSSLKHMRGSTHLVSKALMCCFMCFQVADNVKPCVKYCNDRLITLGDSHSPCRHSFSDCAPGDTTRRDGQEGGKGSTIFTGRHCKT